MIKNHYTPSLKNSITVLQKVETNNSNHFDFIIDGIIHHLHQSSRRLLSELLRILSARQKGHDDQRNHRENGRNIVDGLLTLRVNGRHDKRRHDHRTLVAKVDPGNHRSLDFLRICSLQSNESLHAYRNNGDGRGRGHAVADPQERRTDHGKHLVGHADHQPVEDDLQELSGGREVGDGEVQLLHHHGVKEELLQTDHRALDAEKDASDDGEKTSARVGSRVHAVGVHEVVSVAGVVRVHRPAHAELEDHAEDQQQRDLRTLLLGGRVCGEERGREVPDSLRRFSR